MTVEEGGPAATVEVVERSPDALTIAISGELDLASVDAVQTAVGDALQDGCGQLVLDLAGLTFMDSSGIALMLRTSKEVGSMTVRNVTPIVRRVLEVTGLVDVLGLDP